MNLLKLLSLSLTESKHRNANKFNRTGVHRRVAKSKGIGDMKNGRRVRESGACWSQTWKIDVFTDESDPSCETTTNELVVIINTVVLQTLFHLPKIQQEGKAEAGCTKRLAFYTVRQSDYNTYNAMWEITICVTHQQWTYALVYTCIPMYTLFVSPNLYNGGGECNCHIYGKDTTLIYSGIIL